MMNESWYLLKTLRLGTWKLERLARVLLYASYGMNIPRLYFCVFGISVAICAYLVIEVGQPFYRGTVSQPFKACDCHTGSDLF
jgi:hypothetical protein